MPNKAIDADVVCPFYISETGKAIKCEGLITPVMAHRFETEREKLEHERFYCTRMYKFCECPVYRALMVSYGEGKADL